MARRSKEQREHDYSVMAAMLLEGKSQQETAAALNVSQKQISLDWRRLKNQWNRQSKADAQMALAMQKARLDHLEAEYWAAWHRSREEEVQRITETTESDAAGIEDTVGNRRRAQVRRRQRLGEPRFLEGVRWVWEQRSKLDNLFPAQALELTGKDGGPVEFKSPWGAELLEQWERILLGAAESGSVGA